MAERKPIVVGVDGSEAAQRALDWALDEAVVRGSAVRAVRAWTFEPMSEWVPMALKEAEDWSAEALAKSVRMAVEGRAEIPAVEQVNAEGGAADVLVREARDAELLVVAGHRGEHLRKVVLGSVSAACVRKSTVPVVVLPPQAQVQDGSPDAGA